MAPTETLSTGMGDIPATGRSVTLQLCDVMEFKDGKVYRQRTYFDTGSMMAQLGLAADEASTQQFPHRTRHHPPARRAVPAGWCGYSCR